jgi:hypothetical protein
MLDINFLSGVSLGPDHAWATGLGLSEDETDKERVHLLVEWRRDQGFDIYQLALEPFGLAVAPGPGDVPTLLVMYSSGRVDVFRGDASSSETIASPPQLRTLRDLRAVGASTFAVGMSRQVYRRSRAGVWTPYDDGARHQPGSFLDIRGFNSIHGLDERDMFAVGFDGEIWRCCEGKWTPVDSPTNVMLNVVEVVRPDVAFACGLMGTLLRGQGDAWRPIEHEATEESFVGMASFQGRLYLSDGDTVFLLENDESLTPVDFGEGQSREVGHLHAAHGALWAFGPRLIMRTTDGANWIEAESTR